MIVDLDSFIAQRPTFTCVQTLEPSLWRWRDALYQAKWDLYIFPSIEQKLNIEHMAFKLMKVKELYPANNFKILSWLRFQLYNEAIGGAKNSYHTKGMAVDLFVEGRDQLSVRDALTKSLQSLGLRMEHLKPYEQWVHLDFGEPKSGIRYFLP